MNRGKNRFIGKDRGNSSGIDIDRGRGSCRFNYKSM